MPITKILVANRSEIAIRVFRAANELGIKTVAVCAEEDKSRCTASRPTRAYQIGRGPHLAKDLGPIESYLSIAEIIRVARLSGADAIHPGYGLLSESPEFADACAEAGIIFIGPTPETMRRLGNKVAARNLAIAVGVPVMPATEPLPDDRRGHQEARRRGRLSGHAQGLLGRRRARHARRSASEADAGARGDRGASARRRPPSARTRSISKSWSSAPATSRCRSSATRTATSSISSSATARSSAATRRSSSARRRPISTPGAARGALRLRAAASPTPRNYVGAGTVEFLMDADTGKFYFIEVNPRIQVEHTVTEEVTGIDIVKAQIHILEGVAIGTPESGVPAQADIRLNGHALQCRITTEDPEHNFIPDYGRITAYRGATGFGIRLDGGTAYSGAVITRFYDPLLEKVTAWAPTPAGGDRPHGPRAARVPHPRRRDQPRPSSRAIITHPSFRDNSYTTRFIDTTPELFAQVKRQDRATKLLTYLADVTVNGHPETRGRPTPEGRRRRRRSCPYLDGAIADGTQAAARRARARRLRRLDARAEARARHRHDDARRPPVAARDPHAHARHRRASPAPMRAALPQLLSLECWGGATFDVAMRFLTEDPWERLATIRERAPNLLLQMLLRGANGVGYTNYPDNVVQHFVRQAAAGGIDLFRVFDCLNWVENMRVAMDAVVEEGKLCEAAICYTGDILDPDRAKYDLKYYVGLAKELEAAGAHIIARQGHGRAAEAGRGARAGQGAARGDRPADPFPHP